MFSDMTKMFDPQAMQNMSQQWQKYMDMNQALQTGKVGMDNLQQLSGMWAKTFTTCYEKQMKMCQGAMDDSIECLRDMSSAKGVEDIMSKQAEWSRKAAEKCQTSAQDLAKTLQTTQTECTDIISKMMVKNLQNGTESSSKNSK
jgi:phasin family protein